MKKLVEDTWPHGVKRVVEDASYEEAFSNMHVKAGRALLQGVKSAGAPVRHFGSDFWASSFSAGEDGFQVSVGGQYAPGTDQYQFSIGVIVPIGAKYEHWSAMGAVQNALRAAAAPFKKFGKVEFYNDRDYSTKLWLEIDSDRVEKFMQEAPKLTPKVGKALGQVLKDF